MDEAANSYYCTECNAYRLKVLKFGGTSVGSPTSLRNVGRIVAGSARTSRTIVVTSAVQGVTDLLVGLTDSSLPPGTDSGIEPVCERLVDIHFQLAVEVLPAPSLGEYRSRVNEILEGLRKLLVEFAALPDERIRDAIAGFGERLSAPLVARTIAAADIASEPVDADDLVLTDANYGSANIDLPKTILAIRRWFAGLDENIVPVVTGFIGSAPDGSTTTLGRGGSDLTAAIVARALSASMFERWTDVEGLYSAHPSSLEAEHLPTVRFSEALRVNGSGSYGMHSQSLSPLTGAEIPVQVGSTSNPEGRKTIILPERPWLTVTRCRCEIAV